MAKTDSKSGAVISKCGVYRYALWRNWDANLPKVLFICLNPSTADASRDDPTLRRCMDFAKRWGYGGTRTVNLFAYRATNPTELLSVKNPIGPRNDFWIRKLASDAGICIAAWGNDGALLQRASEVKDMLPQLHCLKMNKSGEPAHPLYLRANLTPLKMPD